MKISHSLPSKGRISHLQQAKWDLEKVINHIKLAFGDSDVTDLYIKELTPLLADLESDIDDTWEQN